MSNQIEWKIAQETYHWTEKNLHRRRGKQLDAGRAKARAQAREWERKRMNLVVDSYLKIAPMRPTYFSLLRQDWIQEKRNTYTFLCRPHLYYIYVLRSLIHCVIVSGLFLSSQDDERYRKIERKKSTVTSELISLIFFSFLLFSSHLAFPRLLGAWVGVGKSCLLN